MFNKKIYMKEVDIMENGKGYGVFSADYMNGALHIERIDELMLFKGDNEASIQAEKDGIKLIKDLPINEDDYDFAYFIDTIENRKIIQEHLLKRGIIYNAFR